MNRIKEPLRYLTNDEAETIHRNALRILSEVGMTIDNDEALDYLEAAGCKINREKRHVLFPGDVVEKYVGKMRGDFASRRNPESMAVRYSNVRFRKGDFRVHPDFSVNTGGYGVFIYDFDGVRRQATLQDTRDSLKLAAQLDQITFTGLPVAAQDVPIAIRPVMMAAELVKITDKLGGIETFNAFDVEYTYRIAKVVRGSAEELRKNPVLVGYAEARTPLMLDNNMAEVYIEYIKRGMPQSLDTMPNAGATAPIHPAGMLALSIAETLSGVVLAYAIDEDACVTVDITPGYSDMRTGLFKYAGAERPSLLGARIQMISEYYGCPSGVHGGKSDAGLPGIRTGVEKGISMLTPVLCGAIGFGTVGCIDAVTYSHVQLVIDNQIAGYVRRVVRGFEVSDATIDIDLIKRVGIGGNYLQEMETVKQFRDILHLSPYFEAHGWSDDIESLEARKMENMAREEAKRLIANEAPSPLSDDQVAEIDEIVAEAGAKLAEQGKL
ncbi:MAG: trimethylamine methyltransferase family protein [Planctomycetes bacterium]|nr:trimethylamine methyltransferase family protein [Planctomycetota bacterium]